MPWETTAGRSGLTHCRVQPPDAENRMSGGVGGSRRAIAGTRPDRRPVVPACSGGVSAQALRVKLRLGLSLRAITRLAAPQSGPFLFVCTVALPVAYSVSG